MRVLQVIDTFEVGGAERVAIDLSNLLFNASVQVEVLCLRAAGPIAQQLHAKIPITCLNRKGRFDPLAIYKYLKLARQFDLIHVHMRHNYRYCRLFGYVFRLKTPFILHDHTSKIDYDPSVPFMFNWILRPSWYIGVSKALTNWAISSLDVIKDHILLLRNIVTPQEKIQYPAPEGIVLVSNFKAGKNIEFAIELAAHLSCPMTIIGQIRDDSYFEMIKNLILEKGLDQQIQLKTDFVNIQAELPKFRLGLHTSVRESGPLVLLEYLAQGLPFLSYQTGEISEQLAIEFPEYFLQNFNCADWVKRIESLLGSKADTSKMEQVFSKEFGPDAYTEKCLKFYQRISPNC